MWTIFIVQLIGLISPGPDFFYVCRKAMADSRRSAIWAGLGISLGVGFWAIVVLFGLAFLNRTIPDFQYYLMLAGGSYLAYSGVKMARVKENAVIDEKVQKEQQTTVWKEFLGGLAINLSNPKIVVFFSSVLAGYVANIATLSDSLAVLAILVGSSVVWFWLVAILFSQKAARQFYASYSRYLDNAAGVVFMLFGSTLIYEAVVEILH